MLNTVPNVYEWCDFYGPITCDKGAYIKLKHSVCICFNCLKFSLKKVTFLPLPAFKDNDVLNNGKKRTVRLRYILKLKGNYARTLMM